MNEFHESLTISDSRLNIDPRWSYLGASPGGIIDCKCCGMGVCEIKCLYAHKDSTIAEAAGQNNFCLKKDEFELYGCLSYRYLLMTSICDTY